RADRGRGGRSRCVSLSPTLPRRKPQLRGCAGPCKNDRVCSTQPLPLPRQRCREAGMTDTTSGERVLIVEDEPSTRLGLTELVRTWGFTTESASDGEDALERITAFRPSIIISDLVMPRMGGLDLLRALKDDGGAFTVVILTAQG